MSAEAASDATLEPEESTEPALVVEGLTTSIRIDRQWFDAVRDVSFAVHRRETLALVGESGCGKSLTALSVMGLLPAGVGRVSRGRITVAGTDMTAASVAKAQAMRGDRIGMIFQEPMTSLNPVLPVGFQIAESLVQHRGMSRQQARRHALELMELVRIPAAAQRLDAYPHQFSGGMRQRVMIAIALACAPKVLITHNLGVVAAVADRVIVMYGGDVVESAPVGEFFRRPTHPYSEALLAAMPRVDRSAAALAPIPGQVPTLPDLPSGCRFQSRCPLRIERCAELPPLIPLTAAPQHGVRCWVRAP